MAENKSIILCEYCGWKRVGDPESFGLHELKNDSMSGRKFRCPGCGRGVVPRPTQDPQHELDTRIREERSKLEYEEWMEKSRESQRNFTKSKDEQDNDQGT
jgi:DNA-directed RNA polymerase subunit RPC12/RpoP